MKPTAAAALALILLLSGLVIPITIPRKPIALAAPPPGLLNLNMRADAKEIIGSLPLHEPYHEPAVSCVGCHK